MKRIAVIACLCLLMSPAALVVGGIQSESITPTPRTAVVFGRDGMSWMERFYGNVRAVRGGDVDLLMIGDSITHGWEGTGRATFDKYYGHRRAVNMGFGGDRTQHVLWRLIHGELHNVQPKVAIVMIGTNNTNTDNPNEIAAGLRAVVFTLRALLPETKVLVLAIFPRGPTPDTWRRLNNEAANTMIAELDDGEWVHYLDIGDAFLDADGSLPETVMPDMLHPNERGYEIWAEAMEPTLAELLGDEPVR